MCCFRPVMESHIFLIFYQLYVLLRLSRLESEIGYAFFKRVIIIVATHKRYTIFRRSRDGIVGGFNQEKKTVLVGR